MLKSAPFVLLFLLFLALVNLASAQTAPVAPRITEEMDDSRLVTLRGNTHRLALPQFDRGAAPADLPMERMRLVLTRSPQQESALRTLLDAQQDRSSASFHHWLTPQQFGEQFGPSDQDIQTVTSWLQARGFQVNHVAAGRTVIEFSGTAAQVRDAFHTEIHKFVVNGEEHWANASDPKIPAALAPVTAGVASLHNFRAKPMLALAGARRGSAFKEGFQPDYNKHDASHALSPADYATIYNMNPLYKAGINGSGATIAILGRAPINMEDIQDFRRVFGLPKNPPQVIVNGSAPDYFQFLSDDGDILEATLDVSWSGAVAPNATVKFIVSASTDTTDGLELSEEYAVDNNVGDIISESFGACESDVTVAGAVFFSGMRAQAAAQGITYVVSSGDSGPYTCDGDPQYKAPGPLSVNLFASSPFAVAVGGTGFIGTASGSNFWGATNKATTLSSALSYVPEAVWNDSCDTSQCGAKNVRVASSGGGASKFFAKPSWQSGVPGIPADGVRDLPDVSLAASPFDAPYLLCFFFSCSDAPITDTSFTSVGGTSGSAPSFAGIMALVVQKEKSRQGQANYVLYRLAAAQQYAKCDGSKDSSLPAIDCVFNDVTSGNSGVPGEPNYGKAGALYAAGPGYDLATGLGSINTANLVNAWSSVNFNATSTSLALSPATIKHGTPANIQIDVSPLSGNGTPTGNASLITSAGPNGGLFPLINGSAVASTATLPGGTYTVSAHYGGDGTFAPSDSLPVPVTVTAEPSTTSVGALTFLFPNAFWYGGVYGSNSVGFSARVAGRSRQGSPTGSILFTDNGAPAGNGPGIVNTEGEAISPNTNVVLPVGQHSIVATYSGDASFLPSISAPAVVTITQAPTTISVQPSLSPAQSGKPVTLIATVGIPNSPFGDPPTGTVTFQLGGGGIGALVKVVSSFDSLGNTIGIASFTIPLPTGTNTVTATYSGDANYLGSTSQSAPVTVTTQAPACTVTNFTADPNPITVFDPSEFTVINANVACQADIRAGSPAGKVMASGKGTFSAFVSGVKDGTTYYLQQQGNTTPQGTLQKLTVSAQSGPMPCQAASFAASPNPIVSPTLSGTTVITAIVTDALFDNQPCGFDIRVGSPSGTLFASRENFVLAPAGPWVTNGMQFFLQQLGDTTPQGTLATLTMSVVASTPLCVVTNFSASPNPVPSSTGVGATTINVNAACAYDVRVGSPDGTIFFTALGATSGMTGPWVKNGMTFYLQLHGDSTPAGTLGELTVAVQ